MSGNFVPILKPYLIIINSTRKAIGRDMTERDARSLNLGVVRPNSKQGFLE